MHAEERIAGIRHGVDEPAYEIAAVVAQQIVLAAKRHDLRLGLVTDQARHPIGVHTGAQHHEIVRLGVTVPVRLGTDDHLPCVAL